MKPEKLLLFLVGAALVLVCAKFPVWGVIAIERKLDVYPIVSQQTISALDEMSATLNDFSEACEWHQAAERDALNGVDEYVYSVPSVATTPDDLIDAATAEMYAAVDRRKALAARADWSLVKSMLVGGQGYTHSTWLCAPAYASFAVQINVGFTPTYDPPAS